MRHTNRISFIAKCLSGILCIILLALAVFQMIYGNYVLSVLILLTTILLCAAVGILICVKPAEADWEEPIGWRKGSQQLLGFIERLLKGCENQRVSGIQIPTQSPFFVVFGVDIVAVPNEDSASVEKLTEVEMKVCDALAEAFLQHYFWPMNIDGRIICVVNLRPVIEDPLQLESMDSVVVPTMKKAVSSLLAQGIKIRIATSGLNVGTESLSIAYQDTVEIFDQLVMRAPDDSINVFVAHPRENNTQADHIVRSQTERLFCNYVAVQDFENACLALLKLLEYEVAEQEFSVVIKRMTSNRLSWTLDVLFGLLTSQQKQELQQKIAEISEATYMDELTERIRQWFELLGKNAAPQTGDSLIPKVMTYINENCFCSELSVSMIGEKFGVNASYLSNSFHNQAGIRIIDYIHQQRIKKIKQLLRETDLTIAQIAEQTGYYNAMSMSRAFKRYEGITPSVYRSSY